MWVHFVILMIEIVRCLGCWALFNGTGHICNTLDRDAGPVTRMEPRLVHN